jgi:hypothetical protein
MDKITALAAFFLIFFGGPSCDQGQLYSDEHRDQLVLWYNHPAEAWTEALPVGTGNMGAMVFGGIEHERFQLNESTIWTGRPRSYAHPGAVNYLDPLRKMLQQMRTCERNGDLNKAREWQTKAEDLATKNL